MTNYSQQPPRPRTRRSRPSYPRGLTVGAVTLMAACAGVTAGCSNEVVDSENDSTPTAVSTSTGWGGNMAGGIEAPWGGGGVGGGTGGDDQGGAGGEAQGGAGGEAQGGAGGVHVGGASMGGGFAGGMGDSYGGDCAG